MESKYSKEEREEALKLTEEMGSAARTGGMRGSFAAHNDRFALSNCRK